MLILSLYIWIQCLIIFFVDLNHIAEHDIELMGTESRLWFPESESEPRVTMTSNKFTRVVRDLPQLGESVHFEVSKEDVRLAMGEAADDNVLLLQVEEKAERSTSEKEREQVEKEKSDDVEMVDGDEDKEDDAEFKPKSDGD